LAALALLAKWVGSRLSARRLSLAANDHGKSCRKSKSSGRGNLATGAGERRPVSSTNQGGGKRRSDTPQFLRRLSASSFDRIPPTQRGFNSPQRISKIIQLTADAGDPAAARNVLAGLGRALLEGRGAMPAVGRPNDAAAGAAFLTWSETRHWLLVDQSGNQPLVLRNAPLLTFGRGAPARLGSAVRYPSHERSTPLLVDDAEHQLQMLRDPRSSAML
jgi:hypothetical protein